MTFDVNAQAPNILKSVIPTELSSDFLEWAMDSGYDESYFNRWDSKCRALEETFLNERLDRSDLKS